MVLGVQEEESKSTIYVPDIAKIRRIKQISPIEKVFRIVLDDEEKQNNFKFKPGQFVELTIFGLGEAPFSIMSNPDNHEFFELCIRNVGSVSGALHRMEEGAKVGIRGPFGNGYFPYDKMKNHNVLLIAGGLGLAPLMSLIKYILNYREDYKEIMIIYGAVNPESILFKNDIQYWSNRKDISICISVDNPDDKWTGEIGVCTKLIPRVNFPPEDTYAVVCGPPVMYKYVVYELEKKKFKPENIYLSLERRMECGVGKCNHCHIGNKLACIDGPVFSLWEINNLKEAI
ncbi:MAG: FAD/NAD(P)-binding protein [Actinobacteria bacterium]|nr:FAD/NAD(P)-binding protein [Actinomycetota bacterium]MBE3114926.1 FAD/NAD(P)-binding protein [Actinomycetota bacterium]